MGWELEKGGKGIGVDKGEKRRAVELHREPRPGTIQSQNRFEV